MNEESIIPKTAEQSARTVAVLVYALQALAFTNGLTLLVAVIINYVKEDDARGTLAETHFRWQIRTFWFFMLWSVIGALTYIVIIGFFIWGAAAIWLIYRIVKGWLYLNDGKAMY